MLQPEFVLAFREAAPYINAFRGKTFVVAVSGECLAAGDFPRLAQDLNLLVSLGVRIVLVHGIRPQIDAQLALRGVERRFHARRRITDAQTLACVKAAIGEARHTLEAQLSMGMPNSPMHGAHLRVASGNFVIAKPLGVLDGVDMQYSGQVRRIDASAIASKLEGGELVLLSPIGYSPTGEAFNLTMEELAYHSALSLGAEKLIFMVGSAGLIDRGGQFHGSITTDEARALLEEGLRSDEVATCLPWAIRATEDGVRRAHLVDGNEDGALLVELFTHYGSGTMIVRDELVKLREANIDDIGDLLALIGPLEEQGVLVRRSREHLEMDVDHFTLLEHDGKVFGCVALYPFPDERMGELACLVVAPERRASGFGDKLLAHVEKRCRASGIDTLFVLTTRTAHWFVERGFEEKPPAILPRRKRELYNGQRRSKVLVKPL
ncbi:amino-acid N-acetyltransferase [Crenobacter caeni]|uniref:Amino-acid acetyltransferase n=1 Tax=Crenobacter caeni TaxID=2705474 RepID=A0A6B2KUL9_9NEIS|nr:amino-acid N-acetyltransferase [Crenobacter caeni]NDV13828.1 amino-acid N-acetyltransferase [Crenobacter caeni]